MPPTIRMEQVKGFSLWCCAPIMSGRGDEVLGSGEDQSAATLIWMGRQRIVSEREEAAPTDVGRPSDRATQIMDHSG